MPHGNHIVHSIYTAQQSHFMTWRRFHIVLGFDWRVIQFLAVLLAQSPTTCHQSNSFSTRENRPTPKTAKSTALTTNSLNFECLLREEFRNRRRIYGEPQCPCARSSGLS